MNRRAYGKALLSLWIICLSGGASYDYLQAQASNSTPTIAPVKRRPGKPTAPPEPAPNSSTTTVRGQLSVVEGVVELQRNGSAQYCRVSIGTPFQRGDLLKVEPLAKATVVCPDATSYELTNGVHGLPCRPPGSGVVVISFDGAKITVPHPRDSDFLERGIPLIISPRATKLLNPHPTLRWTPVAGVRIYQVTVSGPQLHWRAEVNTSTVLVYPDDPEKRLIPGEVYQLTVRAGDHNSDEEDVSGRGFTLLTAQEAQSVYAAEQKIVSLTANLPETTSRLLLAQLYAERGLIADAIEQLRELAVMTHEPGVPQFLGELYVAIGLNSLAKEQFIQALTLAEQGKLVLSRARVLYSLGKLEEKTPSKKEAVIKYWQQAQELYGQIGDNAMVEEIQAKLTQLH